MRNDVFDPVPGATVQIFKGTTAVGTPVGTATTDADGWYMFSYKYTGKATDFTVKLLPSGQTQNVTLKSNGFVVANTFTVP